MQLHQPQRLFVKQEFQCPRCKGKMDEWAVGMWRKICSACSTDIARQLDEEARSRNKTEASPAPSANQK